MSSLSFAALLVIIQNPARISLFLESAISKEKANSAYQKFKKLLSAIIAARVEFVLVGKRIREIVEKELGLGHKAFAHKIAKTQKDVSRYEKSERLKDRAEAQLA